MPVSRLFPPDILEKECYPYAVAYYFKEWEAFRMPYHTHDDTEIMYIISGTCQVEFQADNGEEHAVVLKKGEFVILNANCPHRLIVDSKIPCRMLNVEFRFFNGVGYAPSFQTLAKEETGLARLLHAASPYLMLRDSEEVYHILKSFVLELDACRTGTGSYLHMQLMQLLVRIGRLYQTASDSVSQDTDYYVRNSLSYMHQNYDRDIQVADIAAYVSLHPGYLHRIFKTHTGMTLTAYLTDLRIEKAKMLLQQTDIPVAEVCDYVGIGSRQYFHYLFKKHTGHTPAAYRHSLNTHEYLPKPGSES